MANQPCPTALICDCAPTPFRNFSSEAPDPADFFAFAYFFNDPPLNAPVVDFTNPIGIGGCYSVVSQNDANDCALRVAQNDAWDPWRQPQGGHVQEFGNTEQTCAFPCPNGAPDFIYTIAAGTVIAHSQAEADAIAASLCQYRGQLVIDCTNPVQRSIDLLGIDDPLDMADNNKVVVGDNNASTLAQIYEVGTVLSFSLPGSTSAFFQAASPDGTYATGDDVDGGFTDHGTTYDQTTYFDLGPGTGLKGLDVNDSGLFLLQNTTVVNHVGVVTLDPQPTFLGAGMSVSPRRGFNNKNQILIRTPGRIAPFVQAGYYLWEAGVATLINPPNWFGNNFSTNFGSINENGHAAFIFNPTVGSNPHIAFFNGVSTIDIGSFGFRMFIGDINDNDVIGGSGETAPGFFKAFVYRPVGGLQLLPEYAGIAPLQQGGATDVNNGGFIVANLGNGPTVACLYSPITGVTKKLIDYLPVGNTDWTSFETAIFINNLNQIVGKGTYLGTPNTPYILQLADSDVT